MALGSEKIKAAAQSEAADGNGKRSRGKRVVRTLALSVTFAAVLVVVLGCASVFFWPKNNQAEFGLVKDTSNGIMGEPEDTIDVLFVGDSETYSSISPLQMWDDHGFTSYDCAESGQNLCFSNTILRRALKTQHPKLVVIEGNSIYKYFNYGEAVERTLYDVFPVFEYHNRWKFLKMADFTQEAEFTYTDSMKGFWMKYDAKSADAGDHMIHDDSSRKVMKRNRFYLEQLVNMSKAAGAEVLIVATPSIENWNPERSDEMTEIASELGVSFLDLNQGEYEVQIDWKEDSRDAGDHLNYWGAVKVSDALGQYLDETYDLPDHRDDPAYESWHDSYAYYQTQIRTK